MTTVLWIAVGVLTAAVVFLLLALNGATRTVTTLRRTLDERDDVGDVVHPENGLPVGSTAPTIEAAAHVAGRHFVVFADPGCAACETLIPPLLAQTGRLPVVLVGRTQTGWPQAWRGDESDMVVFDPDERIAQAFHVGFTPHVFVVDEGGAIAAQGPADTLEMVDRLVREIGGMRIIPTEVSRGA